MCISKINQACFYTITLVTQLGFPSFLGLKRACIQRFAKQHAELISKSRRRQLIDVLNACFSIHFVMRTQSAKSKFERQDTAFMLLFGAGYDCIRAQSRPGRSLNPVK